MSYDSDFYAWSQDQAAALKAGRFADLDVEHLIEEIEAMGRSEKRALESRLIVLLSHLLKWQYQPAGHGVSWQLTCEGQRANFEDILNDNPSLKPHLETLLHRAYAKARIEAAKETGLAKDSFPLACPWSLGQIRDQFFYPE